MTTPAPSVDLNPHIAHLEEYTPIQPLEVLSERLGLPIESIVKLDANENPYGPLPCVRDALGSYPYYHIYPDPQQAALRAALGDFIGVDPAQVLAGQGADELLNLTCRLFLAPGDAAVNVPPTFGMYSFDTRLQGAQVIEVPRQANFEVDVEGVSAAVRTGGPGGPAKLLFLTAPNNPCGTWLSDAALAALLELPVMVVLDEAYVEFADAPSRAPLVAEHDNLVVLRTFSKAAGIAGLRLGYGVFPSWLMPTLWKYKQPYNISVAAVVAGLASLAHAEQIEAVVGKLKGERARLYARLREVPYLAAIPASQANFILCEVRERDAAGLKGALERRGVLVRHYDKPGLVNCVRISVGRPEDTDALVAALLSLE